jgi:hypothetical protein
MVILGDLRGEIFYESLKEEFVVVWDFRWEGDIVQRMSGSDDIYCNPKAPISA